MKKSLGIAGGAAVASVLIAASPASAGSLTSNTATGKLSTTSVASKANVAGAAVGFTVANASCTSTSIRFTARTYENGFSGVQQFRQRAQLQKFTTRGWVAATPIRTIASQRFPNDGRNFSFTLNWRGTHPFNGGSWREAWQGVYLNGFGRVVAKTRVIYVICR